MLMPSTRHTPADLRLWAELEEADLAWGKSDAMRRKVEEAMKAIADFRAAGPCYCSISGGKDSAVLAHLVARVDSLIPTRWLATEPLIDPHCRETIDAIVRYCGLRDYREHTNHCRRDKAGWHATGTFEAGIASIRAEVGCSRYLLGVRAEESGGRKIRCRTFGTSSRNACAPLAWWKSRDVFGYAAAHDVPLHPTYAMLGGGRWNRERLRVSFLTLTHGNGIGRAEWEREYYADVLNRLKNLPDSLRRPHFKPPSAPLPRPAQRR